MQITVVWDYSFFPSCYINPFILEPHLTHKGNLKICMDANCDFGKALSVNRQLVRLLLFSAKIGKIKKVFWGSVA